MGWLEVLRSTAARKPATKARDHQACRSHCHIPTLAWAVLLQAQQPRHSQRLICVRTAGHRPQLGSRQLPPPAVRQARTKHHVHPAQRSAALSLSRLGLPNAVSWAGRVEQGRQQAAVAAVEQRAILLRRQGTAQQFSANKNRGRHVVV